ncbi:MAG: hypothetical protein JSR17_03745 [Proteobacteria bacterium]|nr:hypothetical protein [Pseudomonadota bacterium]
MTLTTKSTDVKQQESRAWTVLKLLWKKFWRQSFFGRLITVFLMLFTIVWMLIFYSSFIIWQIFCFVMTKVLLFLLEWYLKRGESNESPP